MAKKKAASEAATLEDALKMIKELQARVAAAEAKAVSGQKETPAGTLSADVSGHPGEDGELLTPLAGKSHEHIFRVHNGLHPDSGKPLPGVQPHAGEFCRCKHCLEHAQNEAKAVEALPPKANAVPKVKTVKAVEPVKPKQHNESDIRAAILSGQPAA